jgi:molybdopterin-containing oxidoreductase family iron-sulfur binding subunit
MGITEHTDDPQAENLRKWRVSRRRLLKLIGAAGVAAVAAPVIPGVLAKASGDPSDIKQTKKGRLRRWAMIIDLGRCDGCQSIGKPPQCTAACVEGHFVPEPMEWIEVYEHEHPEPGTGFIPTPCMQCQNPPCVNVCPVAATWSTPEGIVLIDQDRCIGCRMCMAACPYERRFFAWSKPPTPVEAVFMEYSPEHQTPMRKGVVYKCDFCPDMARAGRLPYCAQACPNKAIYYGDLEEDLATNGEDVVTMSRFLADNHVFRYKEELNTQPRVFYIPGHGERVGRSPFNEGRMPTEWRWEKVAKGAQQWQRAK